MYNLDLFFSFKEEVGKPWKGCAHWWVVQVILDCKEICAPESLKVQLTKLLTANNVLYYNLTLHTQIIQSF